jgi:hypothetical protein
MEIGDRSRMGRNLAWAITTGVCTSGVLIQLMSGLKPGVAALMAATTTFALSLEVGMRISNYRPTAPREPS